MSNDTLVITLHAALSPAEQALAQSPEGAAQVQEFHQQLFDDCGVGLRQEIKRITTLGLLPFTSCKIRCWPKQKEKT